jgi:hypothetical protein
MSKSLFIFLVIAGAVGYYLYKSNRFTEVNATFDYSPDTVSVMALDDNLHDCKLSLTNDYTVQIPVLKARSRLSIIKTDFKQWNGTILESMKELGPQVEFKLRCREGSAETTKPNRYEKDPPKQKDNFRNEEEVDRT